ncbi:hypothetical protein ACIPY2_12630 [Paenarthrobacter sp. NPDC089675]|uniref:hypothetical protein n=1 Tax=Paenarthrobacter sp. NPDC089675 TaxID=3364376 RepID=UPI003814ADCE
MTILFAWIGFCLVFSVVCRRRMHLVLAGVVISRILVPGVVQNEVMPGLHPSTYLFLVFVLVQAAFAPRTFVRAIRSAGVWPQVFMAAIAAVMMTDVGNPGGPGLLDTTMFVLGNMWAPFYVFVFMRFSIRRIPGAGRLFLTTLVLLAIAEAVLAQVQVATGQPIVWQEAFSRIWLEGSKTELGAAIGTFGHGIQVGVFFAAVMPLLSLIPSLILRYSIAAVILATVPLAYGRMGLILTIVGFVFLITVGSRHIIRSLFFGAAAVVALLLSIQSVAGGKLLLKFEDDNGSAALRVAAFDWFWAHTDEFLVGGYPGNRDLKGVGTLGSSLENGYFMVALMFGIVAALALVAFMVFMLAGQMKLKERLSWPGVASAAMIVVSINGYSSIGGNSIDVHLFWFVLAMSSFVPRPRGTKKNSPGRNNLKAHSPARKRAGNRTRQFAVGTQAGS